MYNGIEQIPEDIARDVDGGQPGGLNSHSDLLDQLHLATDISPCVVTDEIFEDLQDLMKFWQVFRHGYGMTLRAQEVDAKYQALVSKVLPEFLRSLQELSDHLSAEEEPDRDGLEDGPP